MIIFMGSSFTRSRFYSDDKTYLSVTVEKLSGFKTVNLAKPCHGTEQYLSSFLYACERYKPKLFFVETARDRSGGYFYVPNDTLEQINKTSPEEINESFITHGIQNGGIHDFRIQSFSDPYSIEVQKKN